MDENAVETSSKGWRKPQLRKCPKRGAYQSLCKIRGLRYKSWEVICDLESSDYNSQKQGGVG